MQSIKGKSFRRIAILLFLLALPVGLLATPSGAAVSGTAVSGTASHGAAAATGRSGVTSSSLGQYKPTFTGPAATGCRAGCSLLTGPTRVPSTASYALSAKSAKSAPAVTAKPAASGTAGSASTQGTGRPKVLPDPMPPKKAPDPAPAAVSCQRTGPSCDRISLSRGDARGVKGLNAVDSATQAGNPLGTDIEPADQGLCAGNGYVVENNNIGEMLIFNDRLGRVSSVIPLDTVMGLTAKGWSSGGDISCVYDYSNGGHWFFTEFASASTEASGGAFSGCFGNVANSCYEAIAVTRGSNPFGPYNVYYLNANYNSAEPGAPYLLNDFTKIAVSRDAFLLFYDEFPLVTPGVGGDGFNGAQEFAFDKNALERGAPVTLAGGRPNPFFNVAIENMGTLPTPDGTCAADNATGAAGVTCWFSVIPALPPDPRQYDNSHGGSAFMLDTLDFTGAGDNRVAVFDWTALSALDSPGCVFCRAVRFGGQLLSGTEFYYDPGLTAPQKAGPIPLGDECGAAGLSTGTPPPASCPEGQIATNGDNFTQASQAQGQLWGAISTQLGQTFRSGTEDHMGAAYWVIGTRGFDRGGDFRLTSQGYVTAAREELEFPVIAAPDYGPAAIFFTLSGDGGPSGADRGGFYPSTAFGRLTASSGGVLGSTVHVADLGRSPQDGFTEYQNYPKPTSPRWGDYSAGVYDPGTGKIYFAANYIQYPNCTGAAFTNTLATCGGTRDEMANWGTSVNSAVP
ncbi:MAG TPA: hypothetical protein VG164_01505 [Trebonia sp.]|nr:hypothetical protein [Trebonia sp.]